ncbi:AlpA family phage regulatory protein [Salmonella enterica subsp. enterica serovar Omuna]|nr:AlpA family phage regulatory protein [Salmonella enterica subsp. enterica serovar Omuna]
MASRYISLKEMCSLMGLSRVTLWRMYEKRCEFPKPHKSTSGTFLGWPESVFNDWQQQQSR